MSYSSWQKAVSMSGCAGFVLVLALNLLPEGSGRKGNVQDFASMLQHPAVVDVLKRWQIHQMIPSAVLIMRRSLARSFEVEEPNQMVIDDVRMDSRPP